MCVCVCVCVCGAENWKLREVQNKYLERFEIWCWRRMEKIGWTDHVINEEVLLGVNEQRNIVRTAKRRKENWIGHSWRRNCLLKYVTEGKTEGKIEVTGRRRRRGKQLLDDLKEIKEYCKMEKKVIDRTLWRTGFGRIYYPVVRQKTDLIN